jgi:hypothetical protein
LVERPIHALNVDKPIRELLVPHLKHLRWSSSAADSLGMVESILAVEEERGDALLNKDMALLLEQVTGDGVFRSLLGPWAPSCTWDPSTVWVRSVRGIIRERVRQHGGCSCEATGES